MTEITMRIRGHTLPGLWCPARSDGVRDPYGPVHVGIQRQKEVIEIIPGDAAEAVYKFKVEVREAADGSPQFHGPFVQRRLPQQFVYLNWGEVKKSGPIRHVPPRQSASHVNRPCNRQAGSG